MLAFEVDLNSIPNPWLPIAALPAPFPIRVGLAVAAVAPMAFLLGWGFPLGLRFLAGEHAATRGWAWAVNGFASVAAAPLSGLIALEAGSGALFALSAASYAVASAVLLLSVTIATPSGPVPDAGHTASIPPTVPPSRL